MGLIITLILLALVIAYFVHWIEFQDSKDKKKALVCGKVAVVIVSCICIVGLIITYGISYSNYLSMMERKVTIEQDVTSINAFIEAGVGAFAFHQLRSKEITDFKFGAYQTQLAYMINSAKSQVQAFNEDVVGKKLMKSNWYWSWVVYMPNMEMEPINMAKLLEAS